MQEYNNIFFDFCAANQTRLARYTFQIESYSDIGFHIPRNILLIIDHTANQDLGDSVNLIFISIEHNRT